jgi:hypothetical protein
MKLCLTFFMVAIGYQAIAMPPLKEDPDVEIRDSPEDNYIEDDRAMDWDAVPDKMNDMGRIKLWYNDLMSSAHNEILMKAKLVVAVESPLEDLVADLGVNPSDAQLIQNFAFAQLMKIRDYEQQQMEEQMMELEKAQAGQRQFMNEHEGGYAFENPRPENQYADAEWGDWNVQNPGGDQDYF